MTPLLPAQLAGALLALASAAVYGAGDFAGGRASTRANPFHVLTLSGLSGLAVLGAAALALREGLPGPEGTGWSVLSGVAGAVGLASLYRALSMGQAAVVAPVSAVIGASLPVAFSAFTEGLPGPDRLLGFVLALGGIWLVSAAPHGEPAAEKPAAGMPPAAGPLSGADAPPIPAARGGSRPAGVPFFRANTAFWLAVLAGVGFGGFFILIGLVERGKLFTPLMIARVFTILTAVLMARGSRLALPGLLSSPVALLAGLLDAGGNLLYVLARQLTRLDVAAVLTSLYPASTVILSAALLKEKITPTQKVGVLVCLGAILLIARS